MDRNDGFKIIEKYSEFSLKSGTVLTEELIKTEIMIMDQNFPVVILHYNNTKVEFELFKKSEGIFQLELYKAFFENNSLSVDLLERMKANFKLEKRSFLNPEYYSLYTPNDKSLGSCTLLIKSHSDSFIALVFSSKKSKEPVSFGQDSLLDDIIYINGIWQVEITDNDLLNFLNR